MRSRLFISLLLSCFTVNSLKIEAVETLETVLERPILQNAIQLTSPSMGFEKAGEAYFSPDGTKVVFQAVAHGRTHYQIYIMDIVERKPRLLSTGRGACTCAYFRPDGVKIIFASSHEDPYAPTEEEAGAPGYQRRTGSYRWSFTPYMNIYEVNVDGTALTALTSGEAYSAECAYSADGERIVFASNRDGSMNIYTMAADGSDVRQVTHTSGCYNGGPFFSPDGNHILFRADRDKPHYLQVYIADIEGDSERQLTFNDAVNWAPYWHPNGRVVAFTTSLHGHHAYEIYGLNIETGRQQRLTYSPTFDGLAVFSPDGSKMLWTSKRGVDGTCQLFLADFNLPQELN